MSAIVANFQKTRLSQFAEPTKGTKQAWAAYVRRRWPQNTQANCERAFDLSPGRANGLVWSNVTLPTIDHILERAGPFLAIEIEAIRFGLSIEAFLERCAEQEREAIADERRQFEAREARAARIEAMARERRGFAGDGARQGAVPDRRGDGRGWAAAARVGGRQTLEEGEP